MSFTLWPFLESVHGLLTLNLVVIVFLSTFSDSSVKQNGLQLNFALLTNEANPLLHCLSRTRILI